MKLFRQILGLGDESDSSISCKKLWTRLFLNSRNRDDSNYFKVRKHNIYTNGSDLYSGKDKVTYFYTIDGYPSNLVIDFREAIRQEAKEGIKISFVSLFENTRIPWESAQMRSKIKIWKNMDSEAEDVDEFNYRENVNIMDNNVRRKQSLVYLSDAEIRRQRKLFKLRSLMIVSGERGTDFDITIRKIQEYCASSGLMITRITSNLQNYLRTFSPFSLEFNPQVFKEVGNTTISDELVARFSSYDQGKVGKDGMYWGTDIESGFSVFKPVKKNKVDAENILITGETGSGKSYFLKGLLLQFAGNPLFKGTIMDIEGFEYLPFAGFLACSSDVVIINMAEGKGRYFDPVEINVTGDSLLDEDMFSFSKSFTLSVMKTLLGKKLASTDWADIIVNNAVAKTYASRGVYLKDKSTWGNSRGLTLFDVYETMKSMYSEIDKVNFIKTGDASGYKSNKGYKDSLDLVIAKLSSYFEPLEKGGTRSDVFQDRVSLKEIRDAKLVVCSFGMAGKSADMVDPIQMSLMQLSAANISHVRSLFSQANGLYNYKVWEEFQRWGAFPDSEKTITTALTGGRKLGDVNLIVTNRVQELLDSDRFGIFGNTTSFAIGAIDDASTRSQLCERLSIPLLQDSLDDIVTKKGSNETLIGGEKVKGKYDNAFLIKLDKSVSTVVRFELPDSLAKSDLFRTGDVESMKA